MALRQYPYLDDTVFLDKVNKMRLKEQHVKITVLTFEEKPIADIEGKIQGGNINLDGGSSVRRTCNLTMVADEKENDLTNVKSLLSISKKVKIFTGFTNTTGEYKDFPIIWFPLGIYVIINPNISSSTSGINISLQLKDKMCLLNGECGGTLPASTRFDEYDVVDQETGQYVIQKPTLYRIIFDVVQHFGGEQAGKIIINDVPDRIKQVIKWTGSKPLYLINTTNDKDASAYLATISEEDIKHKEPIGDTEITIDANSYKIYRRGDNVGYIYVDFVYPNELVFDGGASVCDVLDAVKNLLGNYEYFYDVEGNFIFQEKKNYLNNSLTTSQENYNKLTEMTANDYLMDFTRSKSVFTFDDSTLIISYANAPQYQMIKNDFIVWGKKKNTEGLELPIRYHLAIDEKPIMVQDDLFNTYAYVDPDTKIEELRVPVDYTQMGPVSTWKEKLKGQYSTDYYYQAEDGQVYSWDITTKEFVPVPNSYIHQVYGYEVNDWRYRLYLSTLQSYAMGVQEDYQAELKVEFPKIFDFSKERKDELGNVVGVGDYRNDVDGASLDYWLDFIDTDAPLMELSVSAIGKRSKIVVDDTINCIFEPAIPDVVYIKTGQDDTEKKRKEAEHNGCHYTQVEDSIFSALAYGGGYNAAYDMVRSLLYQYTSYNESISLQAIPIYYLEPNTRITVNDKQSGISGDYIINNISLPLDISSTMSLSCSRVLERL